MYYSYPYPHFYFVTRQLIGIPKEVGIAFNEILKLTAEYMWGLLIVLVCDKGEFWENEPSLNRDSQAGWLPFGFPIYFSVHTIPADLEKSISEIYWGRRRWELGSWILIRFLALITSDFLAITSSIQMQYLSSLNQGSPYWGPKNES